MKRFYCSDRPVIAETPGRRGRPDGRVESERGLQKLVLFLGQHRKMEEAPNVFLKRHAETPSLGSRQGKIGWLEHDGGA